MSPPPLSISSASLPSSQSSSNMTPTSEEVHPAPTTALLHNPSSINDDEDNTNTKCLNTKCLTLLGFFSLAFAFIFFYFLTKSNSHHDDQSLRRYSLSPSGITSRPLASLLRPTVILISTDGFRFGYQHKTKLPNINRLIANGTEADIGLVPVFPTLTFPNHYSIVTGLYPSHHGIVNNHFLDPITGEHFSMSSHEPHWWLGEPLWETVTKHNLSAATYFWPGSEVDKGPWHCPEFFCQHYNGSVPFEQRVDTVLSYFDMPKADIPAFVTLYFEDPDHQGHQVGPDDVEVTNAVARIDRVIGRLIQGLEERQLFEDVSLILVGDHGMAGYCEEKFIYLEDLAHWIEIPDDWVQSDSAVLAIRPPPDVSPSEVLDKMNRALSSGAVKNGKNLKLFLKEDLPERLHYSENYRIPPIVGLVDEGYKVATKRSKHGRKCGGDHGYDNAFLSMRTIFVGHGPRFRRGWKVPSFENVEIYNVIASILNLKGSPNNGSASFPETILLPTD